MTKLEPKFTISKDNELNAEFPGEPLDKWEALYWSVLKWEFIVSQIHKHPRFDSAIGNDGDSCALCVWSEKNGATSVYCAECPVYAHTGLEQCQGTPYRNTPSLAQAKEELAFLESLLPAQFDPRKMKAKKKEPQKDPNYFEPWEVFTARRIRTGAGHRKDGQRWYPIEGGISSSGTTKEEFVRRIVAAVNFVEGIPTETLEQVANGNLEATDFLEPWHIKHQSIQTQRRWFITTLKGMSDKGASPWTKEQRAERIIAAVNHCAGIPNEVLETTPHPFSKRTQGDTKKKK